MNKEELHIARIKFKNKVLSSSGQAFEDLFVRIMQMSDENFRPVATHGKEGDKKNDGFNKEMGRYYQVYAPDEPTGKESMSKKKLKETIDGLFDYWQNISPIKEFYWVFNDKFKTGVYPSIEKELSEIERKYNIKAEPFLSSDLEDIFLSLPDDEIRDILGGFLPDYTQIENVDLSILGEVIDFLVNVQSNPSDITFPDEVNFENKIRFNGLSKSYGKILNTAFHQDHIINEYFRYNSRFAKEEIKEVFKKIYSEGLEEIPEDIDNKPDLVFEYILEEASPRKENAIIQAVYVLMAHYFESCDIYKEPQKPEQKKLF
ncbi:MAG: ABC-three component system protein [Candidatus Woesearchaeota archaeon]